MDDKTVHRCERLARINWSINCAKLKWDIYDAHGTIVLANVHHCPMCGERLRRAVTVTLYDDEVRELVDLVEGSSDGRAYAWRAYFTGLAATLDGEGA